MQTLAIATKEHNGCAHDITYKTLTTNYTDEKFVKFCVKTSVILRIECTQVKYINMEQKNTDVHIKSILNSPVKSTPAVAVPQISKPATPATIPVPGSNPNDPQTNITLQ